jgi:hypothetical protein
MNQTKSASSTELLHSSRSMTDCSPQPLASTWSSRHTEPVPTNFRHWGRTAKDLLNQWCAAVLLTMLSMSGASAATVKWKASLTGDVRLAVGVDSGNERVFVASEDKELSALSVTDGNTLWTFPLGDTPDSAPVQGDSGTIFATAGSSRGNGHLFAINTTDGSKLWDVSMESYGALQLAFSVRLYSASAKAISAFDPKTGEVIWRTTLSIVGRSCSAGNSHALARVAVSIATKALSEVTYRVPSAARAGGWTSLYSPTDASHLTAPDSESTARAFPSLHESTIVPSPEKIGDEAALGSGWLCQPAALVSGSNRRMTASTRPKT